ncbi:alpha/beta fold hydrolase [Paenibacillus mesotrionivorans]|uniref:Alpha/beta fold hydrolase n=1 Tax=Paenibacillus mesotrionivorans TaxID=3160968 RepID=A0ACC7P3B5_9BACL
MAGIFKSTENEQEYLRCYSNSLALFEADCTSLTVPTSWGETRVLRFGDTGKPPLVLLHGMTMSSTMWYPNVKHWLKERCVYTVDVMGDFGRSQPDRAVKSRQDARQWLLEVMDGLRLDSTDLAGHSMGGFLALNFALAHPERISRLMLYAPAGTFHKISFKFFAKIYPALLFHTEKWIDRAFAWFSGKGEPLHPVFRAQVLAGYRYAKPLLQVMPSVFPKEEFKDFQVATLLLVGDKEVIYPAGKAVENARSLIPGIEARLIPGASHSLTIEHADIVNQLTLDFLKTAPRTMEAR